MFKKKEVVEPEIESEMSISIPSAIEIESIEVNQDGGGVKYYDNIFSRNVSKL